MTSFEDEQIAVETLNAGALDYIVKSRESFSNLPRVVDRVLREWELLRARQQNEARIMHFNSVLRGIRNVNQLITKEKDRQQLLQAACEQLVETMGYGMAWITIPDENGRLDLAAQAGIPGEVAGRLKQQLEQGSGPACVRAALQQEEVVALSKPEEDCQDWVIGGALPDCGVLAAKMAYQGSIYGVMTAAVPAAYVFDSEVQSLFHELVHDLAFALYRLQLEEEHQQSEQALVRSEARYRGLVENIEDVVFSLDIGGNILYVNPAVERVYGYTPEELTGRHFQNFVHPEDLSGLVASFQRTLEGVVEPFAFRSLDKHGGVHYLRSTSRLRFEDGQPVGVNGIAIEITEIHQALEAERHSAERWQTTFNAISDTICVLSKDHEFIEINQAGCKALGLAREKIIGKKCFEIVHNTASPIAACPCQRAAEIRGPVTSRHEEGGRTLDLVAWPILGSNDQLDGFVHIVKDITEEVSANREKEQLEEQLRQAQRLESVGRLAGGVAHDFNNLLSIILNYAEFALEELREGDPIANDIEQIYNAGKRAAVLVRQLLAFSRKQLLEPRVLNLNEAVTGVEGLLRRLLGEDIDIVVRLADDLGNTKADAGQLEQVLMNLVVNARDAMPRGGKLIIETANAELDEGYVDTHFAVEPGRYVSFSVTDTGQGIDVVAREHIFEPFFTTKEKGKGTGLGLSTVYGIVKQSGGNIWVYSEPGRGTTFKIYLPRSDEPVAGLSRPTGTPLASGKETILIVEDEAAVLQVAQRVLTKAGYRVLTATNGGEALLVEEAHQGTIDLLLTDVVMPHLSGRELAERMTANNPKLKTLYMSGYTDNAIVHHGVFDAGTRFIGKPFNAAELRRKVRDVLDEAEGAV
jgi:PAS domain S-box-containing protein